MHHACPCVRSGERTHLVLIRAADEHLRRAVGRLEHIKELWQQLARRMRPYELVAHPNHSERIGALGAADVGVRVVRVARNEEATALRRRLTRKRIDLNLAPSLLRLLDDLLRDRLSAR